MVYKDIGLSEVTKELHPDEEEKKVKVGMMMRCQQRRLRRLGTKVGGRPDKYGVWTARREGVSRR